LDGVPNFIQSKLNIILEEESNDKSLEAIEKELNAQIKLSQSNRFYSESNDDYQKFLQNSQMANMINNYYYDIPQVGLI
jgi:hypothetical protein